MGFHLESRRSKNLNPDLLLALEGCCRKGRAAREGYTLLHLEPKIHVKYIVGWCGLDVVGDGWGHSHVVADMLELMTFVMGLNCHANIA